MAKKIYISPSSQTANMYAVCKTSEAAQCRKIALHLVDALIRCGFEAKTNVTEGKSMYDRVRESNTWKADAHIPIHTNACDGKVAGFRGFYYSAGGEGYKLVDAIMDAVAPITPGTSDGISAYQSLYEVRESTAPCAYLELGFHDNKAEAQYIIDHTAELAEAICKGICNYYKVKYVAPQVASAKLWRVQVGAFQNKSYAEALEKKLEAAGYDAFIVASE
jgi:N-acetylmuramoyl-L-alanine amidase